MSKELSEITINKDIYSIRLNFLQTLYTSPVEAYRTYLNSPGFSRFHLHLITFYFLVISILFKLIEQWLLLALSQTAYKTFLKSLPIILIINISVFVFVKVLDNLLIGYQWKLKQIEQPQDLFLTSFIPFFTASIFLLLPSPYFIFFLVISFIYSVYSSILNLLEFSYFTLKDFLHFFLLSIAFILLWLFLGIATYKVYKYFI
jgi:hypothetical protein